MHMVESMFYVREVPWHGLGLRVEEAPSSQEAIRCAGLDWPVVKRPLFTTDSIGGMLEVPERFATVRGTDNAVFGLVGKDYRIVQNSESFDFTDFLVSGGLGGEVKYETAGSLEGGKRIWLLARMPSVDVLGDEIKPYLAFTNSHDGKSALRIAMTPVRVVCNNTLNLALGQATRVWSTTHKGDIQRKMADARRTLELADVYIKQLQEQATLLAGKKITDEQVKEFCTALFLPDVGVPTDRQLTVAKEKSEELQFRYFSAPDLARFRGTGWGFLNAVTDFVNHTETGRQTVGRKEKTLIGAFEGYDLVNEAQAILAAA